MENKTLTICLFDEYTIKELSEEAYREKTNYKRTQELLTNLFLKTQSDTDLNNSSSIQDKLNTFLNRFHEIRRAFGLYFNNDYFGYISFVEYDSATPEIQIELAETHRNKGIGYKALSLLTNQIFQERKDIDYFIYRVLSDNIASIKLIEKLGGKKVETGHLLEQIITRYHLFRK